MILVVAFTYPLMIYPANETIERWTVAKVTHERPRARLILSNISRLLVCALAAYMATTLAEAIDVYLAYLGAIIGAPLNLIMPVMCHHKLIAYTADAKRCNITLIVIAFCALALSIVGTTMSLN